MNSVDKVIFYFILIGFSFTQIAHQSFIFSDEIISEDEPLIPVWIM